MGLFCYDIHTHTRETSRCGRLSAPELVSRYMALGYDGIAVTDHMHEKYINSLDCKNDWDACVDTYLAGFRTARDYAGETSRGAFDVILGMEIRYPENDNDYLVFGIDENFLRANPYLYRSTPQEFYERYGEELMIIQAHPYRDGCRPAPPCFLQGIEVFNGNPRHDSRNAEALKLAEENPRLIRTCGSDTHRSGDEGTAAMLFGARVRDSAGLLAELRRNQQARPEGTRHVVLPGWLRPEV
jgi:hypothetical protein